MPNSLSAATRHLILIKHSLPEMDRERPSREWQLNDEGRRRIPLLAERLRAYQLMTVYGSEELKAAETARLAGAELGIPWQVLDGVHEHERRRVGFLSTQHFVEGVRDLFAYPSQKVFGDETADQAYSRFARSIDGLIANSAASGEDLAVVTHGTVISLFVSRRAGLDGFPLWQNLDLPALVVLRLPGFRCVNLVKSVV